MPLQKLSKTLKNLTSKARAFQSRLQDMSEEKNVETVPLPAEEHTSKMTVEISLLSATKIILLIFAIYLGFSFLGRITNILIMLFFSIFLATTLNPGVDRLQKTLKMPRGVATIIVMVVVISIFLGILGGVIPILAVEIGKIWEGLTDFAIKLSNEDFSGLPIWLQEVIQDSLPAIRDYFSRISPEQLESTIVNFAKDNLGGYLEKFGNLAERGFTIIGAIFGGIFQTSLVLILTFFLVLEKGGISEFFVQIFPQKYEKYLISKASAVQQKVAEWVHGQVSLFLIIGLIAYFGLKILGLEYALTLALIAGLAEFLPYVGPFIAFASAAPVAFNTSFGIGVATMVFYAGLQALEGNVILPLVMKKAVGISPIVTIIAMLIGWEFLGIMGMVIAVPIASIVSLFVSEYRRGSQKSKK